MEETQFKLLKLLQERPEATQRELAEALGVSLGKTHYCLRALIDKGWVKARNFGRNPDKLGYAHLLTPRGIEAKARLALSFLNAQAAPSTKPCAPRSRACAAKWLPGAQPCAMT